jgi:hypothetical protein
MLVPFTWQNSRDGGVKNRQDTRALSPATAPTWPCYAVAPRCEDPASGASVDRRQGVTRDAGVERSTLSLSRINLSTLPRS